MARGIGSGTLALGTIATLALAGPACAGEFGGSHACSRADAHSARVIGAVEAPAEAALAVEAVSPLPAVATAPAAARAADEFERGYEPRTAQPELAAREESSPRMPDTPPEPRSTLERAAVVESGGAPDAAPIAFRDYRAPKERFRAWRELRLLRLWDDTRLTVWFGLDRKGRPGLHFRQRNPGEEVPLARAAPYAEPPPLRSVPLTSP